MPWKLIRLRAYPVRPDQIYGRATTLDLSKRFQPAVEQDPTLESIDFPITTVGYTATHT